MSAAEYMHKAKLCRKAAKECADLHMRAVWMGHCYALMTMALRKRRGWK